MTVRRVVRYSLAVRAKFDPHRPAYTEAVKSLAAFAPDERLFSVLVGHLDAACKEARTHNLGRLPGLIRLK